MDGHGAGRRSGREESRRLVRRVPPRQTPLIEPDVGLPSSGSPTMFTSQLSQQVAIESTQRANALQAL